VYADSAYRSAATEAKLKARGLRSRIHQRASRNHCAIESTGKRKPPEEQGSGSHRARVRCSSKHRRAVGLYARSAIVRAKAKIGLQNLVYNIRGS